MDSLIGFFIKVGFREDLTGEAGIKLAKEFSKYLSNENGIESLLQGIEPEKYGKDIDLILFECHLKPSHTEIEIFKDKVSFRKKERSMGVSVIFNERDFFNHSAETRLLILKKSLIDKLSLLENRVKSKKIDLDVVRLKADMSAILGVG